MAAEGSEGKIMQRATQEKIVDYSDSRVEVDVFWKVESKECPHKDIRLIRT